MPPLWGQCCPQHAQGEAQTPQNPAAALLCAMGSLQVRTWYCHRTTMYVSGMSGEGPPSQPLPSRGLAHRGTPARRDGRARGDYFSLWQGMPRSDLRAGWDVEQQLPGATAGTARLCGWQRAPAAAQQRAAPPRHPPPEDF